MSEGSSCRILVIDANPADVTLLKEAFREADLTPDIHVVSDGDDALAFLYREGRFTNAPRPDMILLERELPMTSGLEVLQRIKSHPELKDIPVVVCSAFQSNSEIQEAHALKADATAHKSAELEKYFAVVRNLYTKWCEEADSS